MASLAPSLDTPKQPASARISTTWLMLAAACLLAMQVELLFAKSINWDEFFHFSQIHASLRGEPVQWLQTPHVYLFSWVPALTGSAIDHILITRLLILPFAVITGLAIFDISRRFADTQSAALAALAFAGGGNVFLHAFALRADMIAAALLTGALWILATRPRSIAWALGAAALCGLAAIATIKSVLYAPALLAMAAWRWQDRLNVRSLAIACCAIIAAVFVIYAILPAGIVQSIQGLAGASFDRMFSAGLFPQGRYFFTQLVMAPILTALIVLAILSALRRDMRMPWWLVTGLVLPIAWVLIYRNAFPYFFAFILPPAAIACALGVSVIVERYGAKFVLGAIIANAMVLSVTEDRTMIDRQRAVQSGIAQIFPAPVHYIDDIAFLPNFPRAVPHFASGWALENYHRKGRLAYSEAMQAPSAPLLFRQGYALETMEPTEGDREALLLEDAAALRDNYIEHWGRIFVAGKHVEPSKNSQRITIRIAGDYTVERSALTIGDTLYPTGSVISFGQETVQVAPLENSVTLRWAAAQPKPDTPFPYGPLFTNY